jgi:hypothetical protein
VDLWRRLVRGKGVADLESAAMLLSFYRDVMEAADGAMKARLLGNFQRLARACNFLRLQAPRARGHVGEGRPLDLGHAVVGGAAEEDEAGEGAGGD